MPRSFDMATDYAAGVEQVYRAFCDERYWLARLADSGADEATLDLMEHDGQGGVNVVTTQVLHADRLPGLVTQFHPGDLAIRREERWTAVVAGRAGAEVTGAIAGAPVSLAGRAVLEQEERLARLAFRAKVDVRIPLVGGKVEKFIGSQLLELLNAEQRFTTRWIADNH